MPLKLTPGEQIARGRYILRRYVSRGAHAELWEAEQTGSEGFRRQVALKIVGNREGLSDPARDSLLREGRLAARLNHPNIIQLYDVGQEERFVYIAMEFIHGADLRQCLRAHLDQYQKAVPWYIVARIGSLIARGLEHAHNQADEDGTPLRIVHRDVKPSNILLSHNGLIKLIDFGIAKSLTLSNNRSVEFKGTVAYVSPEQIRSEELDHRSDLFSFGVLLYEMLSGKRPFDVGEGGFGAAMIATLERQPPRLITFLPDIPPEMDQLIYTMLSKDRSLRPHSDREVYTTFENLLRQHKLVLEQEHLAAFYDDLLGEDDATVYNVRSVEAAQALRAMLSPPPSTPTAFNPPPSTPTAFNPPPSTPTAFNPPPSTPTAFNPPPSATTTPSMTAVNPPSHLNAPSKPVWSSSDSPWDDDEEPDTIPVSAATDIHTYLKRKLQDPPISPPPYQTNDDSPSAHRSDTPNEYSSDDDDAGDVTTTRYEPLSEDIPVFSSSPPENRLPFASSTWEPNSMTLRAKGTPQSAVPVALGKRQRTLTDDAKHPYAEDLAINTPTSHLEPRSQKSPLPASLPFPSLAPLQPLHSQRTLSPPQHLPPAQTAPSAQTNQSPQAKIWPYLTGALILLAAFLFSFFFFRR